jgi:hypothetical protein
MMRTIQPCRPAAYRRRPQPRLGGITDTLSAWKTSATTWIAANPVDVVYAGAALGALALLAAFTGGGRHRR